MSLSDFDPVLKSALNQLGIYEKTAGILLIQDDILCRLPHKISNYAYDCGVFSALSAEQKKAYAEAVHKRIWTGGYLFLRCRPEDLKVFEKRFYIRKVQERFCILQCKI